MGALNKFWQNFISAFQSKRFEEELAQEMRVHLERLVAYNRRAGLSQEEALREARRRLGGTWFEPQRQRQRPSQPARHHAA